jgi:hypothetical protein
MMARAEPHRELTTAGFIERMESQLYVAKCPDFEVISQGTTTDNAKEALVDALHQHLAWHKTRGTLDHFLSRRREGAMAPGERVSLKLSY